MLTVGEPRHGYFQTGSEDRDSQQQAALARGGRPRRYSEMINCVLDVQTIDALLAVYLRLLGCKVSCQLSEEDAVTIVR